MNKLTKEQAAVIGAYTGFSCGPFSDVHKKIEDVLERPVFTHELASFHLWKQVREKMRDEFMSICYGE